MSTVAVVDDVVYAAELDGHIHCLNAKTGERFWQYDTKASIWGSPYFVDGKVLLGTEGCEVFVFKHEKKPDVIGHLVDAAGNIADARRMRRRHARKSRRSICSLSSNSPRRSAPRRPS